MRAIGIDLGTTNSVAAYCEPDQVQTRILENSSSERWTPSAVSARGEEAVVGRAALNNAMRAPRDTIVSVKRLMGRDLEDPEVANVRERVNYELAPGPDSDPRAHVMFRGTARTPVEISAMVLRKIKEDATRRLGEEVTHAVITVPAYFKLGQRVATRDAGVQAGLVVQRILDEPTAAAIAFGVEVPEPDRHRILVFDLGGGTFDVSILQMVQAKSGKPQFVVLHYEGDNWLGGDDFDYAITGRIVEWVKEQYGEDPSGDPNFRLTAKRLAEQAKRDLSETNEAQITCPAMTKVRGMIVDVDLTVTREEFQSLIEGMVARTLELANAALGKEQLSARDISDVLLVGGATMTPLVYERVEAMFGNAKVRRNVNAMECVAQGAAILAANTTGVECPNAGCRTVNEETATACSACGTELASARSVGGVKIDDVTGMSFGIRAVKGADGDVFVPIIPSGTPYPLPEPRRRRFQATDRRVRVPVYQGEDPVASRNSEQGSLVCELPKEYDPSSPVDVQLNFDKNGIITVMVSVPGTEFSRHETIRYDQPRTRRPADPGTGGGRDRPEDDLAQVIEFANRFLDDHEDYMTAEQAKRLRSKIARAVEGTGGPRMPNILFNEIQSSEVAYRLFNAGHALNHATAEEKPAIREAQASVRDAWDRGEYHVARERSRVLNTRVRRVFSRVQSGEATVTDHGGLLRIDPLLES